MNQSTPLYFDYRLFKAWSKTRNVELWRQSHGHQVRKVARRDGSMLKVELYFDENDSYVGGVIDGFVKHCLVTEKPTPLGPEE